ncbi:MAG: glucose-1-phosphate adenylyltransferase subunit GlgD [Oscillospiraceae bacterium]|nr:glucose-1-phosphate adenylyltransferase subunit GlgD [Oscillospiraceae bacterium]
MVKRKTMGIILANMHDAVIGSMSGNRALASLPFAGRYRLVDFNLSALVHAGISDVGVIVQENYHSLMRHIGAGREWDLARKIEGVLLYPPFIGSISGNFTHNRVNFIHNVLPYIEASSSKYTILMDCNHVCNVDVSDFVNKHIDSGADVSLLCYKPDKDSEDAAIREDMLVYDRTGRVIDISHNVNVATRRNTGLSMNIMVMARDLLIELIEDAYERKLATIEQDILLPNLRNMYVRAQNFEGFARRIRSVQSYFHATMSLLDPANSNSLFLKERPIYTKVNDDAPARYGDGARVVNSLIADGCDIDGYVENCVLFRGVKVQTGASAKNSILMQNSILHENADVSYVIADKYVEINSGRSLVGYETYPLYIHKRSIV